jgi:hypothetical protein
MMNSIKRHWPLILSAWLATVIWWQSAHAQQHTLAFSSVDSPLATILRITPEVVPVYEGKAGENSLAVANAVRRHKDEVVLVVGHITVTGVIAALDGPRLPTICDNVFSDLFMLDPSAGEGGLLHLHYGAVEDISPQCRLTAPLRENRD